MDSFDTADRLAPGTLIGGRYAVTGRVGLGGMSTIYDARDGASGARVAVKLLRPALARNPEVVERFMQEAHAARRFAHPNIVRVLDLGEDPATGSHYIVQEFLDGMDLARWTEVRGAIPPAEAVAILTPLLSALEAVHAQGIVHRDIKPENVFLAEGRDGELVPKLIDFGVSKVRDGGGALRGPTQAGIAIGTPEYMSPEQARGDGDVDARSDVWSLGVMLYQLLSGRTPHDATTQTMLLVAIITERPIPIERVMPGLAPELVAVVHRALEPDRAARFQTIAAFRDALLRCPLGDDGAGDEPVDIPQQTSLSLPVATAFVPPQPPAPAPAPAWPAPAPAWPAPAPPAPLPAPRPASTLPITLGLSALVLLGALAAAVVLRRRAPPPTPTTHAAPIETPEPLAMPEPHASPEPLAVTDAGAFPLAVSDAGAFPLAVSDAGAFPLAVTDAGAVPLAVTDGGAVSEPSPRRRRRVRPRNNAPILAP